MYRYPTNLTIDLTEDGQRLGEIGPQPLLALPESAPKTTVLFSTNGDDYADDVTTTGSITIDGGTVSGTFLDDGSIDWLRFEGVAGQSIQFIFTGFTGLTSGAIRFYDAAGISLSSSNATNYSSYVNYTPESTGVFYIALRNFYTPHDYTVEANAFSDDFSEGTASPGILSVDGSQAIGEIESRGDVDWFEFTVENDGDTIGFLSDIEGLRYTVIGQSGSGAGGLQYGTGTLSSDANEGAVTIEFSGTYYVSISSAELQAYNFSAVTITDDIGGTPEAAAELQLNNTPVFSQFDWGNDQDWFEFDVTAGETVSFFSTTAGGVNIYDSSGNLLNNGQGFHESISYSFTEAGQYYLNLDGADGSPFISRFYELRAISYIDDSTADFDTDVILTVDGATIQGSIDYYDDVDWMQFQAFAGQTITFEMSLPGTTDIEFYLYTLSGELVRGNRDSGVFAYEFDQSGTYLLSVETEPYTRTLGDFEVTARTTFDDFGNFTFNGEPIIIDGESVTGNLINTGFSPDVDVFTLDVTAGQIVEFSITERTDDFPVGFVIADSNGQILRQSFDEQGLPQSSLRYMFQTNEQISVIVASLVEDEIGFYDISATTETNLNDVIEARRGPDRIHTYEGDDTIVGIMTCAPTSYHFLVESFDCFDLMRPSVASVDFGHIHTA